MCFVYNRWPLLARVVWTVERLMNILLENLLEVEVEGKGRSRGICLPVYVSGTVSGDARQPHVVETSNGYLFFLAVMRMFQFSEEGQT